MDGLLPQLGGALAVAELVVHRAVAGVEAAELVEPVRPVVELLDRLLVVVACFLEATELAIDIGADLQRAGKFVDAVVVAAEHLLRLEDGGGGGVNGLVEVAHRDQFIDTAAQDLNEGSCW
jgi:hypothetical protein